MNSFNKILNIRMFMQRDANTDVQIMCLFREKEKTVATIYEHLKAKLQGRFADEDDRIKLAQVEIEAAKMKEEEMKKKKRLEVRKSIEEHRIEDVRKH